ncbi:hypothetical protein GCM10008905_24720 [Clostridium malenominatum]|uniref:Csp protease B prodomain domain-containing protein n=1 Tax=Clostridium malenominatum TaxID=1539 RepID=A0ABN1J324_9CLOT
MLKTLKSLPKEILSELAVVSRNGKIMRGKIDLIVKYSLDSYKVARMTSLVGGEFEDLGYNFGIITMNIQDISKISSIKAIEEIELPKTLYCSSINYNYEQKKDSIVGFISSNIDHNLPEENNIIMIKATAGKNINHTKSTIIMKWIKYLVDRKRELEKQLIIYSSFHPKYDFKEENNLFYKYINSIREKERVEFIFEKNPSIDKTYLKKGKINKYQSIDFDIKENGTTLQLYKEFLNNYTIEITNTFRESSGLIKLTKGYKSGTIGENIYHIYNTGPKAYNIDGEIVINVVSSNEENRDKGKWKLNIICEDEYKGQYVII